MKCQIPQISWHSRDPVLSIDFQPIESSKYRLASGGTDSHVLIWYVTYEEDKTVNIECASDLNRHSKSVNVVRFSPNGETLASGDDEGAMFVWQLREGDETDIFKDSKDEEIVNKEEWYPVKVLRAHLEDIYDISWSSDGNFLVTASMDNCAIIWDMQKYVKVHMLSDFKGYVQGVSWDPCNKFIASLGSDRTLRIHSVKNKKTLSRISKAPWSKSVENANIKARLFYDDTLKSYCRRLSYTPDGELLIVPSGIIEKGEKLLNTCYVFSRHSMSKPVLSLHTKDWYTVAVRCNPFFYKLRNPSDPSDKENERKCMIDLPYRMIFAVAACDSVLMYDTEQLLPFACISNIHYTRLTDLAWSPDGLTLVASSTDGYCSFIVFTREELGEIYIPEKTPEVEIEKNCEDKQGASDINQTPRTNKSTKQKSETPKAKSPMQKKPETPKTDSPKQDKSETPNSCNTPKTNQTSFTKNKNDEVATPSTSKAISTSEKKMDKTTPKIGSIMKYFTTTKTPTTTPPTATKVTESKSTNLPNATSTVKTEPILITLDDIPKKEDQSLKLKEKENDTAVKTTDPTFESNDKMDIDDNINASDISVKKKGKCRMRLDFAEKDNQSKENITDSIITLDKEVDDKNSPMMPIQTSDKNSMEVNDQQEVKLSPSNKTTSMIIEDKKSSKEAVEITNIPSDITQLSLTEKFASPTPADTYLKIDAKKEIEPAILFDENASDGDTTTSVSDLKSAVNDETLTSNENDWKLELSLDTTPLASDIKAQTPVPNVTQPSTPESKTPKRRVPFVTLSSKPSFKK